MTYTNLLCRLLSTVIVFVVFSLHSGWAQTLPLLVDEVSYTGWSSGTAPMTALWTKNSGSNPAVTNSMLVTANSVIACNLPWTLTHDFEIDVDMLHAAYSRLIWVGLFNADGTQGYGFSWDSALATQYGSQGKVNIKKFSVTNPVTDLLFNTAGTVLNSNVKSGHNATNTTSAAITGPMARFKFTWNADTHTLQVSVDGAVVSTVTDSSFSSFSRIYVSGSTGSMIDNIVVAVPVGATMPFTTYEAEDCSTTGTTVLLSGFPSASYSSPEMEASGRAYVSLSATGQYLETAVSAAANTVVLRHCIPDASAGGGTQATLNLYVNGTFRQTLTLSSTYNWYYGNASSDGRSENPSSGASRVFWDESRFFISGSVNAGDVIRLEKDADNTASFYRIDLFDLEQVVDPIAAPAAGTYLSVADYGANGSDTVDDTAAIQNCITAAKAAGKIVWIPAGTYYQSAKFTLDGVTVQGAGQWYTNIVGTVVGTTWGGTVGFSLIGTAPAVKDLHIEGIASGSQADIGARPITGNATGFTVDRVWITHTHIGCWMNGSSGTISNCRIRFTYADGINLNSGANGNLVTNNHLRGIGDDGIALLATTDSTTITSNNTVRSNTVIANWWGQNCDLAGGGGNVIEYNYLADNSMLSAFTVNLPSSYPMYSLTSGTVRCNAIVRGGGNLAGQKRGAVWIYPTYGTVSNLLIQNNYILDAIFKGIHIGGSQSQQITFQGNVIDAPAQDGFYIRSETNGSGTFQGNTVLNLSGTYVPFNNLSGSTYIVTESDNSWD